MIAAASMSGRGPRTGSSRKNANPAADSVRNPRAYWRSSGRVVIVHGTINSRR